MVLPWPPKAHCDLQRFEDIGKQKLRQTHHEIDSISIVSAPCAGPLSRTDHKYIHHINTSLHPQATYSETRDWPVNWLHPKAWQFSSQSCAFIVFHCSRTPGFGKRMTSGLAAMGSESRCRMKTIDIVDHTYEANYVSRKTRAQRSHLPGVLVRLGISKDNVSQCLPFIATGNGKTTNCLRSLFLQCPMTFKSVFPQISSLTWDWHHRTMSALGSNTLGSTLASITSFLRWRSTKSTNSGVEQSKLDRKSGNCAMKSNKNMSCAVHCDIVHKSFAKIHKWHLLDDYIRQSKNQALRRGRCWHGQILHWAATARLWEHLRVGTWN